MKILYQEARKKEEKRNTLPVEQLRAMGYTEEMIEAVRGVL